ncbi:hypothetical protein Tco_1498124 [Tanacetum coccineum]
MMSQRHLRLHRSLQDKHPPSPDYVPGPEHPPSPDYVPEPEYLEYLVPSDDERKTLRRIPPIILLRDDDNDDDEEEASEEDEDEEEVHLTMSDSAAPTPSPPRSPQTKVPFSQTRLCRAQKTVRLEPPIAASTEALIAKYATAPTLPSPPPSPLSPWSSPLPQIPSPPLHVLSPPLPLPSPPTHTSPTYADAPLGYRATMIQWRAASPSTHHPSEIPSPPFLLPSTSHRDDIPEVNMLLRKRAYFTALASRFEVGASSSATTARQTGHTLAYRSDDRWGEVNERVTDLAITQRQEAQELYVLCEDAQDDRALLRAQVSLLTREWRYFLSIDYSYKREAADARRE